MYSYYVDWELNVFYPHSLSREGNGLFIQIVGKDKEDNTEKPSFNGLLYNGFLTITYFSSSVVASYGENTLKVS